MEFSSYIERRIEIFDRLYKKYEEEKEKNPKQEISIVTKDTSTKGKSWETTPFVVSKAHNPEHASAVVAKVDGVLWDMHRPLEKSCAVEFLSFADEEGKKVFWHSSAHVLGEACEKQYQCNLCLGPPTDSGFFYEMQMDKTVVPEDYSGLGKEMKSVIKENQKFLRLEMDKKDLLEMFSDNPLKVELIQTKVETRSTVYRCGPLIDFCLGPHVPSTSYVKAIEVTGHSSSFFLGDASRPVLQRVYGISFPSKQQMKDYLLSVEEAKKYNHRKVGTELDLFFFSPMSPGSGFFLPKGAFVYNTLVSLMKEKYRERGFKEVISPNIYTNDLWKTSGHWDKYKDDMFCFCTEGTGMALKPMNCPGHCVMFKHLSCSYRELPLRLADFGVLHRNEVSGSLTGLTRVRRFQQDDAHIFTQASKVSEEIEMSLDFLKEIYTLLGFTYSISLSTRPSNYLGEIEVWNSAESQLKEALDKAGCEWALNEGDGAFYGPKIDITVEDAMGRKHQCGTIQLDFQMPKRFDLKFRNASGEFEQPVMIHRAILGSLERVTGILLEHFKGKLPPWLNPNQIAVLPLTAGEQAYAQKVAKALSSLEVFVDLSDATLNKKILNAEKSRYSFVIVVGPKDVQNSQVSIRKISSSQVVVSLEDACTMITAAIRERVATPAEALNYLPKPQLPQAFCVFMHTLGKLFDEFKIKALKALHIQN
ncbi:threonyl-tRNA synthetase [Nematocida sp. AWRm77]|nr:threonyl-tRNA synthetase [Nematocida sp. AWRm77]